VRAGMHNAEAAVADFVTEEVAAAELAREFER
jgi:hypothetical protein